jgi:hypothetical protein
MPSHTKIKAAVAGCAFMAAFAAGVGGGVGLSNATPPAPGGSPVPVVAPPSPPPDPSEVPAPPTKNNRVPGGRNFLVPSEIRD